MMQTLYAHSCTCGWHQYTWSPTSQHTCPHSKPVAVTVCLHRGEQIGTAESRGCASSVRQVPRYACSTYGECTELSNTQHIRWCKLCEDWTSCT